MKRITSLLLVALLSLSAIITTDTNVFAKETVTQESTTITIHETEYPITHLETQELSGNKMYKSREIWQLEGDINSIYENRISTTFDISRSLYLPVKLPTADFKNIPLDFEPLIFFMVYTANDGSISNSFYYYTGYSEGMRNKLYHYVMEEIYIGNSLSNTESDNDITVEFEDDEYDATYLGHQEYQENEYRDFWRINDTDKMLENTIIYHSRIPFINVPVEIGNFNKPKEQFLVVDTVSQGNVNREVYFFNGAKVYGNNIDMHNSVSDFYYKTDEYYSVINVSETSQSTGKAYLYGEVIHFVQSIYDQEIELWKEYYNKGMRHLFIESPYFMEEYVNIWMKSDSDAILNVLYEDMLLGDTTEDEANMEINLYKRIKEECPETIFHGTDVGHMYDRNGVRFLEYLEAQETLDIEKYVLTLEAIEQGKRYYNGDGKGNKPDSAYREEMMTANFIREFDKLGNVDVMRIYGANHLGEENRAGEVIPTMFNRLNDIYVNQITSTYLRK